MFTNIYTYCMHSYAQLYKIQQCYILVQAGPAPICFPPLQWPHPEGAVHTNMGKYNGHPSRTNK